jgi:hypothetical protein
MAKRRKKVVVQVPSSSESDSESAPEEISTSTAKQSIEELEKFEEESRRRYGFEQHSSVLHSQALRPLCSMCPLPVLPALSCLALPKIQKLHRELSHHPLFRAAGLLMLLLLKRRSARSPVRSTKLLWRRRCRSSF